VKTKGKKELTERTFKFAVDAIKFLKSLKHSKENDVIKYQLTKSAISIGANYEESQASNSKEDFYYKIGIVLREARESNYWLRVLEASEIVNSQELDGLIQESAESKKIFGSIFAKSKNFNLLSCNFNLGGLQ
jgi:four helix bundle protein